MKEFLVEHRNQKRAEKNINENKSTSDKDEKTSPAKRLRLRGDWSDTGRFILGIFSIESPYFQAQILVH
jgi:hypothetical protein